MDEHGLPSTRLELWDRFLQIQPRGFDLVLNDINTPPARERMLVPSLDLVAPAGVIIFDDIHKPHYRIAVHGRGFRYYSLQH